MNNCIMVFVKVLVFIKQNKNEENLKENPERKELKLEMEEEEEEEEEYCFYIDSSKEEK